MHFCFLEKLIYLSYVITSIIVIVMDNLTKSLILIGVCSYVILGVGIIAYCIEKYINSHRAFYGSISVVVGHATIIQSKKIIQKSKEKDAMKFINKNRIPIVIISVHVVVFIACLLSLFYDH